MICYLNGFDDARQLLIDAKPLLKKITQKSRLFEF
jgi:hypothetical protein